VGFSQGATRVSWQVTDAAGNATVYEFWVNVVDEEAPLITGAVADPMVLWPPNHKMRMVAVDYTVSDNCGPVTTSLSVTSNEPDTGTGHDQGAVNTLARSGGNGTGVFTVQAAPNPTADQFLLVLRSGHNQPVSLRVTDNLGRLVESRSGIAPNGTLYVGGNYRPGVYYLELMQGTQKQAVRLVKTAQ
jgi:hypothetical protein